MPNAAAQVDDLLLPLLQAEADDARHLIESLVVEHAGPVIKQIIRSKLYLFFDKGQHQDAEDIHSEVQVLLLARLHAFRSHPADNKVNNDCTGTGSYIDSLGTTVNYVFVTVDKGQEIYFQGTNPGEVVSGVGRRIQ